MSRARAAGFRPKASSCRAPAVVPSASTATTVTRIALGTQVLLRLGEGKLKPHCFITAAPDPDRSRRESSANAGPRCSAPGSSADTEVAENLPLFARASVLNREGGPLLGGIPPDDDGRATFGRIVQADADMSNEPPRAIERSSINKGGCDV